MAQQDASLIFNKNGERVAYFDRDGLHTSNVYLTGAVVVSGQNDADEASSIFDAGTAALPGVAVGAATVGLFSGGSGATEYLGFAANGAEVLRAVGDGRIGIGAAPSDASVKVTIRGAAYDYGVLVVHSTDSIGAGVGATLGLGGKYDTSNYTTFATIRGVKATAPSGEFAGLMDFQTRLEAAGLATQMRMATAGVRIESGISANPAYLFQVATTNSAVTLCVSDSLDTVGIGTAPDAGIKLYAYKTTGTTLLGESASGNGVYGYTGTGTGVRCLSVGGGAGVALLANQTGTLAENSTGNTAYILRNPTLNGFDATGAVLHVEDATASTGDLLSIVKQGASFARLYKGGGLSVLQLSSAATDATLKSWVQTCQHYTVAQSSVVGVGMISNSGYTDLWLGGGNGNFNACTSVLIYAGATNTTPTGTEMVRVQTDGLRIESGLTAGPSYLFQVATTNSALTLCVSDSLDTVGMGVAPHVDYKLKVSSALYCSLSGENTSGIGIVAYCATTGVGLRAEAGGAGLAIHAIGSATSGQSVILLQQLDTDQQFIEFTGTESADAASSLSSWTTGGAINGFVRVSINGTDRWMPTYTAPTA